MYGCLFWLLAFLGISTATVMNIPVEQHHANFVGLWRVDQPMHALYEATLYDFRANGELITVETLTLGGQDEDYVTGTVARLEDPACEGLNCPTSVVCRFGNHWYSLGEQRLVIEGGCSDGLMREIVLDITPFSDAAAFNVEIVSVGSESGWAHLDWDWSWARCESRETCLP